MMRMEGRELLDKEMIDLGIGYSPSDTMELKVVTHDVDGKQLWSSYDDNPLSVVR